MLQTALRKGYLTVTHPEIILIDYRNRLKHVLRPLLMAHLLRDLDTAGRELGEKGKSQWMANESRLGP